MLTVSWFAIDCFKIHFRDEPKYYVYVFAFDERSSQGHGFIPYYLFFLLFSLIAQSYTKHVKSIYSCYLN